MLIFGVTGPRELSKAQAYQVSVELRQIMNTGERIELHVGDALGVDAVAWGYGIMGHDLRTYNVRPELPSLARYAERSTRMVKALAAAGGVLHAWPNKSAPDGLMPAKSWPKGAAGSGTWGTIALAVGLGVPVVYHPLVEGLQLPDWATLEQGVLF
jgi:hypothetical protein